MGLLDGLKKALGREATPVEAAGNPSSKARQAAEPEEEIRVPEVSTPELLAEMQGVATAVCC
jgi:hypothetical protein